MRPIVGTRRNGLNNRRHAKVSFGECLSFIGLLCRRFLPGKGIPALISPEKAGLSPVMTKHKKKKQSEFVDVLLLNTLLVTERKERDIRRNDRRSP